MPWNAKEWVDKGKSFLSRPVLPAPTSAVNWFSAGRGFLVALLLFTVGDFYVQTIRPGHRWAGDFSLYVRHAHNLVKGQPYSDTRFIVNPHFPTYSPKAYPPVYPALLAAVYSFRGPDLEAMKRVGIAFFLGLLLLLYVWLRPDLRFAPMLALLAMLGFHPAFWDFKDMVYADVPFVFFLVLALFVWEKARALTRPGWGAAVAGGLAIYLAYGTRSVGLILVPTVVLGDLFRTRRVGMPTWRALGVLAVLVFIQGIFVYNDSGYLSLFSWNWARSVGNARDYIGMAADLWENGQWPALKTGLFLLTSLLAAAGYFLRLRLGLRDLELFIPLYAAAMVFWSANDGVRYIFPLVPFYFYYALVGLDGWFKSGSWRGILLLGWVAAAALTYESVYAQTSFGPFLDNVRAPESRAVFRFIRDALPRDAVLVAREPRVFGLYTGRRCSIYHLGSDAELWNYFHQIKAGYLVVGRFSPKDREFFRDFTLRHQSRLTEIFANYDFKVYQIHSFPE